MIIYFVASTALSDAQMYPGFFRTIPTTTVLMDAMLELVVKLHWRRVLIVYDLDTIGWPGKSNLLFLLSFCSTSPFQNVESKVDHPPICSSCDVIRSHLSIFPSIFI